MLIELLLPCRWGQPGDVRDFYAGVADVLVRRGIAKYVAETAAVKPQKESAVRKVTKVFKNGIPGTHNSSD